MKANRKNKPDEITEPPLSQARILRQLFYEVSKEFSKGEGNKTIKGDKGKSKEEKE